MKLGRALLLLAACRTETTPAPAPPPTPTTSRAPGDATARTRLLLTGIADDWSSTRATLQLWERTDNVGWHRRGEPWSAVLGRNGIAAIADKREGDGKSPAGRFSLRAAYGYADHDVTHLPYTPSANLECVDDPSSAFYNQIVGANTPTKDWRSAEQMRRDDVLYTHVIELGHNATRTPGRGSCIFLHVWSGPESTTSGCTAMPQDKLETVLGVADQDTTYVLLPSAEYTRLATDWDLPPQQ